ncbi:hypothetical protein, partial [Bacteroides acidifaciens]|uniref:hypothetical protein n=1 Tax=Bacteroides acidifaciens TaxID=85831 RepID=UPI00259551D9
EGWKKWGGKLLEKMGGKKKEVTFAAGKNVGFWFKQKFLDVFPPPPPIQNCDVSHGGIIDNQLGIFCFL